jgi:peroxiredoxin
MRRDDDDVVSDLPVDFVLPDERGAPWRLADHLGGAVVLLFLRGDW